ncbi:phosphopantothenoylcysteine decarboxylase, partial [Bacillus mycoides]|uniref:phosphopantothenoylcysteine decarboxylase domain-containing protein n=2 Tax=Bacteria TaxID=2 RepID=UPI0024AD9231
DDIVAALVAAERADADTQQAVAGSQLAGLRVVISAGPTYEDIDPVRYVGNRSSGKMGYALAAAAARLGASVVLVSGP